MLFNSVAFILLYLPSVLTGFFVLGRASPRAAALWLSLASLVFYACWDARYVLLLLLSIAGNFLVGGRLSAAAQRGNSSQAGMLLFLGVAANLAVLCYYKYTAFFIQNLVALTGMDMTIRTIVLPLGISFFSFTQIAYLADCRQGKVQEVDFIHYLLFVTYFPHLIAGPILHHAQMMPQFANQTIYRPQWNNLAIGLLFFSIGLFKKVVVADGISPYVIPLFSAAEAGHALSWLEATSGALAYTIQLYFDFSGYCDMAIGISRLFGVHLPLNFYSPYKAHNIIEFWRRWHMTLSRFLRDYLYIPLGGNRHGTVRRYLNLFVTMLIGGLWHGAAWTYVIWGAGHGILLVFNHGWHWCQGRSREGSGRTRLWRGVSTALTFTLVVVLWVFFRATTVDAAWQILRGMMGLNGLVLPDAWNHMGLGPIFLSQGVRFVPETNLVCGIPINWFLWCGLVIFFAPNSQQIATWVDRTFLAPKSGGRFSEMLGTAGVALLVGFFSFLSFSKISKGSEFLYFQF